jgi:C-terminal processing protease CtpA/Prc
MHVRSLHKVLGAFLVGALLALPGCSGGKEPELKEKIKQLEMENENLQKQIEKLKEDLRPLKDKVNDLDVGQRNIEKTVVKVKEDLEARVIDIVQQELGGRGRRADHRFVAPPAVARPRMEERPYLGFDGQDIEEEVAKALNLKAKTGVLVTDVREGAPAAAAGIQKNDVLQRFADAEVKSFQDLKRLLKDRKPGEAVTVTVLRGDQNVDLKVTLGQRQERIEEAP